MHKIDADGATVANEFTEGDPALSVPSTTVSSNWLNAVQRELVGLVQGAGITIAASGGADPGNQVLAAVQALISGGGAVAPTVSMTVSNNQTAAADVTGFPVFLTTVVRGIEFLYQVVRHTSSEDLLQTGRVYLSWNPNTSAWRVTKVSAGDIDEDDAIDVIDFTVVTTGVANTYKLQYQTSNMAGSSYSATLRITDIKKIFV